jgi:sugar O-acyltransferase (sialic acid O-acetyltransferase NeuD family)
VSQDAPPGGPLVIVGAGGHGRETLDVVEALQADGVDWQVLGFLDDADLEGERLARLERRGTTVIGPVDRIGELAARFVVAVGDAAVREKLARLAKQAGAVPAPALVHPTVVVGGDVEIGEGTVVAAGSHITTNVRVGRHVQVNVGSIVSHDTLIADYATLSPGVRINGDVDVGRSAFLGTGAVVVRGHTVGAGAIVGAGAVVVRDVEPGITVAGVPARPTVPRWRR